MQLEDKHLEMIREILNRDLPGVRRYIFGSRALGTAEDRSDIDLLLKGDKAIDLSLFYRINEQFKNSDIPYIVDLSDWHTMSEEFQGIIHDQLIEV